MREERCHPGSPVRLILALGLLSLSTGVAHAQTEIPRTGTLPGVAASPYPYAAPEEVGLERGALDALADSVADWVGAGEIVGAEILVVKDRRVVLHQAIGWRDRTAGLPLERNTLFRIRSMTKPFTATSIFLLAEAETLGLEDPVAKYLPSWRNPQSDGITIRQLLSHTGGFVQGGFPGPFQEYPDLRAAVDAVGEAGPQNPPGERYEYSDVGSATLGAIVAEVSGIPLERFIESRILEPLGLSDTHTHYWPGAPWAQRMNPTYVRPSPGADWVQYWNPSQSQAMPFFRASGGLYTTVFDYARWLDLWMERGEHGAERLISKETVNAALTPGASPGYGLHWEIFSPVPDDGSLPTFGHGGSDGTLAVAIQELNATALIFTQSRGNRVLRRFGSMVRAALERER
jgi:CubicO group peptidase (beta-lactamase class C family)